MTPEQHNLLMELSDRIARLEKSDRYTFGKDIEMEDGRSMKFSTGTGTKIGTDTDQKLGFYGVTPISQRADADQAAVSGTADDTYSTDEKNLINDTRDLANELRQALVNVGIIKGSS